MSRQRPRAITALRAGVLAAMLAAAPAGAAPLRIEAVGGGTVNLVNVTNITPTQGYPVEILSDGLGSQVYLPALANVSTSTDNAVSRIRADDNGSIVLHPALVSLGGAVELQLTSNGSLDLGGLSLGSGAILSGQGSLSATLNNNGRLSPGSGACSFAGILIDGDYIQGPDGILDIEIGGAGAGQYDALAVLQTAQLDGTLAISDCGGFTPDNGDMFDFLVATQGRSGQFAATTGRDWPGGGSLLISYSPTGVKLTADGFVVGEDIAKVYTVSPCRVVDTRYADPAQSTFSGDKLVKGETVPFFVIGGLIDGQGGAADCGIPAEATGVFVNVTAVRPEGTSAGGYLTLWPYGEAKPTASTINFKQSTIAIANGVLVALCDSATAICDYDLNVYDSPGLDVDLVIDVTGYLAVPAAP